MKQLSPRLTGTEIDIEMQIHALRQRVEDLERTVRELQAALPSPRPPLPPERDAQAGGPPASGASSRE
jgi:hypothetical protein